MMHLALALSGGVTGVKGWKGVGSLSLASYAVSHYKDSRPLSPPIVWDQVHGWLVIGDGPPAEFRGAGDAWFVAPPATSEVLQRQLERFGLHAIDGLSSFLQHFNGLREQLPGCAGCFNKPQEWQHLDSLGWDGYIENCEGYEGWQNAVMFWHASNGDMVLLAPTGKSAWWVMELNKVVPLAREFAGFVGHFVERIERRYPFSSWPPPG